MKCKEYHEKGDHYYVAGICVTEMTPTTKCFLLAHYPTYQSHDYEKSKQYQGSNLDKKRSEH